MWLVLDYSTQSTSTMLRSEYSYCSTSATSLPWSLTQCRLRSKTKWECLRKCWWCDKDEDDKDKLIKCTSCDVALYCNKECQDKGFPIHEKECKGETKINSDGIKVFAEKAEHDVPLRN